MGIVGFIPVTDDFIARKKLLALNVNEALTIKAGWHYMATKNRS